MFDAWDNVLWEYRSVRRCDRFHQHELKDRVSEIHEGRHLNYLRLGKVSVRLQSVPMQPRRAAVR